MFQAARVSSCNTMFRILTVRVSNCSSCVLNSDRQGLVVLPVFCILTVRVSDCSTCVLNSDRQGI